MGASLRGVVPAIGLVCLLTLVACSTGGDPAPPTSGTTDSSTTSGASETTSASASEPATTATEPTTTSEAGATYPMAVGLDSTSAIWWTDATTSSDFAVSAESTYDAGGTIIVVEHVASSCIIYAESGPLMDGAADELTASAALAAAQIGTSGPDTEVTIALLPVTTGGTAEVALVTDTVDGADVYAYGRAFSDNHSEVWLRIQCPAGTADDVLDAVVSHLEVQPTEPR